MLPKMSLGRHTWREKFSSCSHIISANFYPQIPYNILIAWPSSIFLTVFARVHSWNVSPKKIFSYDERKFIKICSNDRFQFSFIFILGTRSPSYNESSWEIKLKARTLNDIKKVYVSSSSFKAFVAVSWCNPMQCPMTKCSSFVSSVLITFNYHVVS